MYVYTQRDTLANSYTHNVSQNKVRTTRLITLRVWALLQNLPGRLLLKSKPLSEILFHCWRQAGVLATLQLLDCPKLTHTHRDPHSGSKAPNKGGFEKPSSLESICLLASLGPYACPDPVATQGNAGTTAAVDENLCVAVYGPTKTS